MEKEYCVNCKKKEQMKNSYLCVDCERKFNDLQKHFQSLNSDKVQKEKESDILIKSLKFLNASLIKEISNNFDKFPNGNARLFIDTLCSILQAANWSNKKCEIYDLKAADNEKIHEVLKEMGFNISIGKLTNAEPPLTISWE